MNHFPLAPRRAVRISLLLAVCLAAVAGIVAAGCAPAQSPIRIGSKGFTENAILSHALNMLADSHGHATEYKVREAGSGILFTALESGSIDVYPEYTGTLARELLADAHVNTNAEIRAELKRRGLGMTNPLGFNNTYAMAMREDVAAKLGIAKISDLANHPNLKLGFSNEFVEREDGWRAMAKAYGLPHADVKGMQHEIAYEALRLEKVQVMDIYSTDASIKKYDLRVLADDKGFFPRYDAVFIYRLDVETRAPAFVKDLHAMAGNITEAEIIAINAMVDLDKQGEPTAAAKLLADELGVNADVTLATDADRIWRATREHLFMVSVSMVIALLLAIPLGVMAAKSHAAFGQFILGSTGILQTVPSLALLALMVPLFGTGQVPAIVALVLYSLLPIVRNTYTGLHDISPALKESALALGLPGRSRLWRIELPLAARSILAGIKTAAVINVGVATLGTLIGAGGYGDPIMAGIRRNDTLIIFQGVIPAAIMALLVQFTFDLLERFAVSPGLRLKSH